ncbi:MAG TPA: prephenate dehydratase [Burkholderiaceae bacterium]|nr:prephenate dehydratase [Burkholderiaceae bacterium]
MTSTPGHEMSQPDDPDDRLGALRAAIDAVDREIVERLNRRARLAQQVGELKHRTGAPVYRPEREAQIMARLRSINPGPLSGDALEAIWREVVSACRELERRLRVAYLGPAGTFSEQALLRHFGSSVDAIPCPTIDEVFRATEAGTTDFGVVPVENSSEGAVNRTLDLFLLTPLSISGEVSVPVRQSLMTLGGSLEGVRRIASHPQSLAQCAGWLERNAPGVERLPVASNAEAARLAAQEPGTAAIAGDHAAQRYGLQIVARSIQDDPNNRTRFAVIGRYACAPSGADQTSLILSVPDRAGAVHALIEPFARHGVSMKRFESRPARQGLWEYYFYIDVIGHRDDPPVAAALAELESQAAFCKVIGSYPRAT